MNRVVWFGLVVAIALGLATTPALAEMNRIKIAGGPTGTTLQTFAKSMALFLPKVAPHILATAMVSSGSMENVKRVSSGESDFGLCYAVDSALGYAGKLPNDPRKYDGLRAMGYLYGVQAQLVVKADSKIGSALELEGQRVALGDVGSRTAASAESFFRYIGVWNKLRPIFRGYSAAASAFKEGRIDAFWVFAGYPDPSVIEASVKVKIRLIDVGLDAEKSGFYDLYAYSPTVIPADTYGKGMPASHTFRDAAILSVNKKMPDNLVYAIMKRLWSKEGIEAMVMARKAFKEMTLENNFRGATVPLHPGAVKFWQELGLEIPARLMP